MSSKRKRFAGMIMTMRGFRKRALLAFSVVFIFLSYVTYSYLLTPFVISENCHKTNRYDKEFCECFYGQAMASIGPWMFIVYLFRGSAAIREELSEAGRECQMR